MIQPHVAPIDMVATAIPYGSWDESTRFGPLATGYPFIR